MRKLVNFKVLQCNEDVYINDELSTLGDYSPKYDFFSLHLYDHKGEVAKDFEDYILAYLKRVYAKNLATLVESNKFVYCNNMKDVISFINCFIQMFSDVFNLQATADIRKTGSSIKELITCYERICDEDNILSKKNFNTLSNFLLKLPSKISIKSPYLDQYAVYYAGALRCFLYLP